MDSLMIGNPQFQWWPRGDGPFSNSGPCAGRWLLGLDPSAVASVAKGVTLQHHSFPPTLRPRGGLLWAGRVSAGASLWVSATGLPTVVDGQYEGCTVTVVSGLGAGQTRTITFSRVADASLSVSAPWTVIPDATSVIRIDAAPVERFHARIQVGATGERLRLVQKLALEPMLATGWVQVTVVVGGPACATVSYGCQGERMTVACRGLIDGHPAPVLSSAVFPVIDRGESGFRLYAFDAPSVPGDYCVYYANATPVLDNATNRPLPVARSAEDDMRVCAPYLQAVGSGAPAMSDGDYLRVPVRPHAGVWHRPVVVGQPAATVTVRSVHSGVEYTGTCVAADVVHTDVHGALLAFSVTGIPALSEPVMITGPDTLALLSAED